MSVVTVPLAGVEVTADPAAVLVTHGLGSCIAVTAWDRERRAGGMLHFQLPSSALSLDRAVSEPGAFADTGLALLLRRLEALGCRRDALVLKVTGGGSFHGDSGTFDIGRRNHTALRRLLWERELLVAAEDVGGTHWRTARLFVDTGVVTVTTAGEARTL